jgi:hypothetical protein
MIFLLITVDPTKRKGKDSRILFRKTCRVHISGMSNKPFNISDIFITIGSGRTKERKIRATPYFVVSFVHSNWFNKSKKERNSPKRL